MKSTVREDAHDSGCKDLQYPPQCRRMSERRRSERVQLSTSFSESDPRTITPVADLSRSGALVIGGPLHPVGARIELCFVAFPDDPMPFMHTGRVVRHEMRADANGESLPAMGVEFDVPSHPVAAQLDAIMQRAKALAARRRRSKRIANVDLHELRTRILND